MTLVLVLLAVFAGCLLLTFSSFQKYLVYRQDGVYLKLPFMETGYEEIHDLEGITREPVDAELSLDGYDFSNVKTNAGEGINIIKAMYVSYDNINDESLQNYVSRAKLNKAKALVLQVKPESGQLVYPSNADMAAGYGLGGGYDLASEVISLKEQGLYLVADVSCMLDSTIVGRYTGTALTTNGTLLATDAGYWMDPYNTQYREYLVQVCEELINMGFDEIMFSYVSHPVAENVTYTQSMSTPPTAQAAVSSFAIYMEKALGDKAPLGVRVSYEALNNKVGSNGQDMEVFGKVFDRIYCSSSEGSYESDLAKALGYMNSSDTDRFVPYAYSANLTNNSWMLLTWVEPEED